MLYRQIKQKGRISSDGDEGMLFGVEGSLIERLTFEEVEECSKSGGLTGV